MENVKIKTKNYILENFLFTSDQDAIDDDTSFLKTGIIDSTGILEIIGFVEEEFKINVEDEDVVPENLDSINLISRYVMRKI
jgi:acyl carrier protein